MPDDYRTNREREFADTVRRVIEQEARSSRSLMELLYASEINVEVTTFCDCGFLVKLGDPLNGYLAETNVRTWAQAEAWLIQQVLIHYPDSPFTRRYGRSKVVPLRSEGRKDQGAADRLIRDMGFDPDKPRG